MYGDMLQSQIDEAVSNCDMNRILALKKIYNSHNEIRRIKEGIRLLKERKKKAYIRSRLLVRELEELSLEYPGLDNIVDFPGK